jgi:hypothetical protein
MEQSSMNVGVQVADGELIMGDGIIFPKGSKRASDEKDGEPGLKYRVVERVFRLLQLLLVNECTRLEIFERLASYYRVDEHITGRVSSSRHADRMLERDIKLLEEQGFEVWKIKGKGTADTL